MFGIVCEEVADSNSNDLSFSDFVAVFLAKLGNDCIEFRLLPLGQPNVGDLFAWSFDHTVNGIYQVAAASQRSCKRVRMRACLRACLLSSNRASLLDCWPASSGGAS